MWRAPSSTWKMARLPLNAKVASAGARISAPSASPGMRGIGPRAEPPPAMQSNGPTGPAGSTPAEDGIGQYIEKLEDLPSDPPALNEGDKSTPAKQGDYSCTTQNFKETRQYDKIVALSANSESLWPGAIVSGDSVYTGLFTQLVFDRSPLAVSISLQNL